MTGWTCPSCGVNYAPSVTECCCSVVTDDWIEQMRKIAETPPVYGPVTPWVDPTDYWRKPPWQRYSSNAAGVAVFLAGFGLPASLLKSPPEDIDTVNVDYLQLASLGGRQ